MNNQYICKIASVDEMNRKWDYEIECHPYDSNWRIWKTEAIKNCKEGHSIAYYGILDGTIICETTAMMNPDVIQNSELFMDEHTVYLCAFRTVKQYRGKGYFSLLFDYMQNDLKQRGFTKAVLGVEPKETENKKLYEHWGFIDLIALGTERFPDRTVIEVEYYGKTI